MNRGKTRVLLVYGSESGTAQRGIERHCKKWAAKQSQGGGRPFDITKSVSGNELQRTLGGDGVASAVNLEYIAQTYDVILVATSSYGDGDPPSNFRNFLAVLAHEASMKSTALTGLQHAVLGFGSSTCAPLELHDADPYSCSVRSVCPSVPHSAPIVPHVFPL